MQATTQKALLAKLHKTASFHRYEVSQSESCACFNCGQSFQPAQITEWTDKGLTALCPHCHMDAVVPSYNNGQLDADALRALKRYAY